MLEIITNVIVYGFIACFSLVLLTPLILGFITCWKKSVLMLVLLACVFLLSIGFAVLVNMLAAIIFAGAFSGIIFGAIWDHTYVV